MISGNIEDWSRYKALAPVAGVFKFLQNPSTDGKEEGKYVVDDDSGIYYLVQHYMTIPQEQGALEAHMKFVDIQYIVKGKERMGYIAKRDAIIQEPYDMHKDIAFYHSTPKMKCVDLSSGMFAVFFPEDCHMPKLCIDSPERVKKVVVKIPLKILRNY